VHMAVQVARAKYTDQNMRGYARSLVLSFPTLRT